jgi:carbon monoxide dehydrogenase subunit G
MEIQQEFNVPFQREMVWRRFQDIPGLVACLPGASLMEAPAQGPLKLGMTVKLGPIVAAFVGDGEVVLDDAAYAGRVSGGGSDRKSGSRVKGEAAFALHEMPGAGEGAQTRIDVRVTYSIAGSLAQFSRANLVQELAARLTQAFAENLRGRLADEAVVTPPESVPGAVDAAVTAAPPPSPTSTPQQARPLDLGGLFWSMLVARLRRLILFWKRA